ncbi:glycosyl hydrolase [Terrilactibacillus sp. S3-3]|nr:glycosyl hydrolase [Terrilactibacillus sp. S3-3]
MRYLADIYGRHILSGQQNLADADWLNNRIGKKPAIVGFDLKDYSPTIAKRGIQSDQIEQAMEWAGQGGIVALTWHWSAPKGIINDPMGGFYTKNTTFNIKYALEHRRSDDYRLLLRDIDTIAGQLKRLQQKHIPVLFRPLHEAEGKWFWWGAQGPGPAKALYRLLYHRLTVDDHLNNLIWVWSSPSKKWYPGDRFVDIIGYDSYPAAGNDSPISDQYNLLKDMVSGRKMAALSETGPIPDPAMLKTFHVYWSWFMTWQGEFLRDGRFNSIEHLRQVYENPYVITLDQLPKTLQPRKSNDKN